MSKDFAEKTWQELYRAALFETDKTKAAERIAHAQQVIVARARTLFSNPDNALAERNALEEALYELRVLKMYTHVEPYGANGGIARQESRGSR